MTEDEHAGQHADRHARDSRVMLVGASIVLLACIVFAAVHTIRYGDPEVVLGSSLPLAMTLICPPLSWFVVARVTKWNQGIDLVKAAIAGTLVWIVLGAAALYQYLPESASELSAYLIVGVVMNAFTYLALRATDAHREWLDEIVDKARAREPQEVSRTLHWVRRLLLSAIVAICVAAVWWGMQQYIRLIETS